jgi:hypothetical protein
VLLSSSGPSSAWPLNRRDLSALRTKSAGRCVLPSDRIPALWPPSDGVHAFLCLPPPPWSHWRGALKGGLHMVWSGMGSGGLLGPDPCRRKRDQRGHSAGARSPFALSSAGTRSDARVGLHEDGHCSSSAYLRGATGAPGCASRMRPEQALCDGALRGCAWRSRATLGHAHWAGAPPLELPPDHAAPISDERWGLSFDACIGHSGRASGALLALS